MKAITLIGGEEIMLALEARQKWREQAQVAGFAERLRYDGSEVDWSLLLSQLQSSGLFVAKRCLEIHYPDERSLDAKSQQALKNLPQHEDYKLLIFAPKLEKAENSAWFKALGERIEQHYFKKLNAREFETYLQKRLQQENLRLTPEALQWLGQSCAQNLVALFQIIAHLKNLPQEWIDAETLQPFLADEALYQSFVLSDAIALGQWARAVDLVHHYRHLSASEKIKLQLGLTFQLQKDASILLYLLQSSSQEELSACFKQYRIPNFKHRHYYQAKEKHRPKQLESLLRLCAHLDGINKGAEQGDYWLSLLHYLLFRLRYG